jgi:hypothetical protein
MIEPAAVVNPYAVASARLIPESKYAGNQHADLRVA